MADVFITREYIEALLRSDLATYDDTRGRAALRAALGDAAALCNTMATAMIEQNSRGGRTNKYARDTAAAFDRCGDEIWRMRSMIQVPSNK